MSVANEPAVDAPPHTAPIGSRSRTPEGDDRADEEGDSYRPAFVARYNAPAVQSPADIDTANRRRRSHAGQ